MKGMKMLALLAVGAGAFALLLGHRQASTLPEPGRESIREQALVKDVPLLERTSAASLSTQMPASVDPGLPVAVEALPDDLPARVSAVIERLRKCQRQHAAHWRTPETFTISAENARLLVAEFEQLDAQCEEAERQYREAHMRFVDEEIDAGRGTLAKGDINQVIKELETAGKYDPKRDHMGYGIRFERGTFYVLAKRGDSPHLDPQLDYCDSMAMVYRERCGQMLSYLDF